MENFGQIIKRRCRELGLMQREVAERIRFEDGRTISGSYLVELEHSTRRPPRGFLVEQFARALSLKADVLYFAAGRLPADLEGRDVPDALVVVAFQAFRRELTRSRSRFVTNGSNAAVSSLPGQV
jgi:transcriptional regulator with XRE-family HTH domain